MKKIISMVLAMVMVLAVAATSASAALINTAQLQQDAKDTISKGAKTIAAKAKFTPQKADATGLPSSALTARLHMYVS